MHCFPLEKIRVQKIQDGGSKMAATKKIVNPDVSACCYGNQVKSYDVRHEDKASC